MVMIFLSTNFFGSVEFMMGYPDCFEKFGKMEALTVPLWH